MQSEGNRDKNSQSRGGKKLVAIMRTDITVCFQLGVVLSTLHPFSLSKTPSELGISSDMLVL